MGMQQDKQPGTVLFLSHGGGPLPLLGDESHQELVVFLQNVVHHFKKPKAIVVISAHWEEAQPTLTAHPRPSLIYDYYGFPEESYQITYPAQGEPLLAEKMREFFEGKGTPCRLDRQRGFDHGLFIPLKIMYPAADIPCVQLSLLNSLDASAHIQMGKALSGLLHENVLIIGSGFSFHNLREFFVAPSETAHKQNISFEKWLIETCTGNQLSEKDREQRLTHWISAPAARFCHPREEHLLPLHVCYGIAGSAAQKVFPFQIMGKTASAYLW